MTYADKILEISKPYLVKTFSKKRLEDFLEEVDCLRGLKNEDRNEVIKKFSEIYIRFVKEDFQEQYQSVNEVLSKFVEMKDDGVKVIWGDCEEVLRGMKSESVHLNGNLATLLQRPRIFAVARPR